MQHAQDLEGMKFDKEALELMTAELQKKVNTATSDYKSAQSSLASNKNALGNPDNPV